MYDHLKKPGARHDANQPDTVRPQTAERQVHGAYPPHWTVGLKHTMLGPHYGIQAKLTINQPGDPYEQEADHVAAQVMRTPDPGASGVRRCTCGGMIGPDGECAACKARRLGLQRAANTTAPHHEAPAGVHEAIRTPGQALDPAVRAFMEPRFGQDFSGVRIHTDPQAVQSAAAIGAHAYTVGQHVVFGAGAYAPGTTAGKRLLAHELAHVVQQAPAAVQRQAAPPRRRTIWLNIGFDSSAQANETTMRKLRASIAVAKAAITHCCTANTTACNVDVKTHYDWVRYNKPAPADGDYDDDDAADRTLRDNNLNAIAGPAGGQRILVTESTLSQTWQGARIFPRANTGASGILWNRSLSADDTIAHEAGHAAGYTGDSEGGSHSSDPANLMSPGSIRQAGAVPDANWCQQMDSTAQ